MRFLRFNSRLRALAMTEYLIVLTCIAIASITVFSLFGRQIKEGISGSVGAIGIGKPNDPTTIDKGSNLATDSGQDSIGGGSSAQSGSDLPNASGNSTGENPSGDVSPKNRLLDFQRSVETVISDKNKSETEMTFAIISAALKATGNKATDAHELVQNLRRTGWTDIDITKYNNPALVNAHYYFKGWMPVNIVGGVLMDIYDNGIKQHLGAGVADAVAEFWSGRNDNRPSSGYSPMTRVWFDQGVADKAKAVGKPSP